jgi:hypothetical protein
MTGTNHNDPLDAAKTPNEILVKLYGNGKPLFFVVHAIQIAEAADESQELLNIILGIAKAKRPLPPVPDLATWFSLYRNHNRIADKLGGDLIFYEKLESEPDDMELKASEVARHFRGFLQLSPSLRQRLIKRYMSEGEMSQILQVFQGCEFPPKVEAIAGMLKSLDEEVEHTTEAVDKDIRSPEWQFYLRVWLPVLIVHKTYPGVLLHRARNEDIDAIDDLLRIDKSLLFEAKIAEFWHRSMHCGPPGVRKRLLNALNGRPRGKISKQKLRGPFAALISQLAQSLMCEVTEGEIRTLFNRVSEVRKGGTDQYLPPGSEAFAKAIQRGRTWPSIPGADKSHL